MSDIQPTFAGEVQLRRWSESSTQGVQITFALADAADLERFRGMEGKRFMAALVQVGDDEQPVPAEPKTAGQAQNGRSTEKVQVEREHLGDLCWRAVQWCRDPEFLDWVALRIGCEANSVNESTARSWILMTCQVESRKELDTNPEARRLFHEKIRGPFQKHLIARGVVR